MRADTSARIRIAVRLALAHHPLCSAYADDVRRVGPATVCAGCAAAWPAYLLSLPIAFAWTLLRPSDALALAAAGLALGLPYAWTALVRPARILRTAAKLLGGAGVAAFTAGALLPMPVAQQLLVMTAAAAPLGVLVAMRARQILRTCDACPWRRDWAHCPGFNPAATVALRTPFDPAPPMTARCTSRPSSPPSAPAPSTS